MLQSDGQWQDHKNDVHIEDYKKEISKEVEDFSKEVPAVILKMYKTHWNYAWVTMTNILLEKSQHLP